jgi:hypothetical protein
MGGEYGIYVLGERYRQVTGRTFTVTFRIIDNAETHLAPYHLTVRAASTLHPPRD